MCKVYVISPHTHTQYQCVYVSVCAGFILGFFIRGEGLFEYYWGGGGGGGESSTRGGLGACPLGYFGILD